MMVVLETEDSLLEMSSLQLELSFLTDLDATLATNVRYFAYGSCYYCALYNYNVQNWSHWCCTGCTSLAAFSESKVTTLEDVCSCLTQQH